MIQREKIKSKNIAEVLSEFGKRFETKLIKKDNDAFFSYLEGFGKLTEEYYEVSDAVHRKNKKDITDELYDVAITALVAIMSERVG